MSKLPRKQIFDLVGESQINEDGSHRQKILRQCLPAQLVTLERQPHNPHDPNAIFIIHQVSGKGIGFISREDAPELAAALDAGVPTKARIHELSGGIAEYPNFGCRICVVAKDKAFRDAKELSGEQEYYEHTPTWRKTSGPTGPQGKSRESKSRGIFSLIAKLLK
jgi:HIRAN domain